jgi:aminopeptidase YwaD
MERRIIFIILSFLSLGSAKSQNAPNFDIQAYGRQIVDTLASPYFKGRGYIKEGDHTAAYFVATEFYNFGLKKFIGAKNYYQNFSFPVNTFPRDVFAAVDDEYLICGRDFVPEAGCPDIKGTWNIVWLDSATVADNEAYKNFARRDFSTYFIVVDDKGVTDPDQKKILKNIALNPFGAKGLIYIRPKLTWSVSTEVSPFPIIEMVRGNISKKSKQIRLQIDSKFIDDYPCRNVIGYVEGKEKPDSFIVISAHYDHLGKIGRTVYFPGANDNASGIAMMLSLAKYFSMPENQPKCSIAFIGFGAEEAGLIGSSKYNMYPVFPLSQIKFLLNVDIMGTGDEGITVVNSTEFKKEFDILDSINIDKQYLVQIKKRGPAANSDHYPFYENKVRCFFAYTMGNVKFYHDIDDRRETLPLTEFKDLHLLFRDFITKIQVR